MFSRLPRFWIAGSDHSRLLVTTSLWALLLRLAGAAVAFGVGVQLARYLTPSGYGTYAIAIGIATILTSFAQFGLPMLAVREISVSYSRQDWPALRGVILWFARAVMAWGGLLALLCAGVAAIALSQTNPLRIALFWASPLIPLMAFIILVNAELRGLGKLLQGISLEIFIRPAAMSVLLLGAMLLSGRMSPELAIGLNLTASVLTLVLGLLWVLAAVPHEARAERSQRDVRWAKSAVPLAIVEVLRQLDSVYPVLIMGALTTTAETGIFRVAVSSMVMVAIPLSVVQVVVAPTLARLHAIGEKRELQSLLTGSACAMAAMALVGCLVLALVGRELIVLLFGAAYKDAWQPLLVLALAQLVVGLFGVGSILLPMAGAERQLVNCYLASLGVSLVSALPLVIAWGAIGAAVSVVLGYLVQNLCAWAYIRRGMSLDCSVASLLPLWVANRRNEKVG